MNSVKTSTRRFLSLVILATVLCTSNPARGDIVTVLFTGFSESSPSGMEALDATLASRFAAGFPALTYSSEVFQWFERSDAFNFINSFSDVDALFLVGHSWGGNQMIRLAQLDLLPAGITVDASFQIDSVDIPFGLPDDVLPENVETGVNFFQISTGPLEPQGETFVEGAININVEERFPDTIFTHTNIDDDPQVHNLIWNYMQAAVPEPGGCGVIGLGMLWLAARRRRTEKRDVWRKRKVAE